jgi:hypothetical protein
MLLAVLLRLHASFDLRREVLGEWELLNLTDPAHSLYTVEFHVDSKAAVIGSAWAPDARDGRRYAQVIFEAVFSAPNVGDIVRLTPERSYFAHFEFTSIEGDEDLTVSRGRFSSTAAYAVVFFNATHGNLTATGHPPMLFRRNSTPPPPRMSPKTRRFWDLVGVGAMVVLSHLTIRWCSNDRKREQLKKERDAVMAQLANIRIVDDRGREGAGETEAAK